MAVHNVDAAHLIIPLLHHLPDVGFVVVSLIHAAHCTTPRIALHTQLSVCTAENPVAAPRAAAGVPIGRRACVHTGQRQMMHGWVVHGVKWRTLVKILNVGKCV